MSDKALIKGFLLAHDAPQEIMTALAHLHEEVPTKVTNRVPELIADWLLSIRADNCLRNAEIFTSSELLSLSESELLRIPNFGKKSLHEVKEYMAPLQFPQTTKVKLVWNQDKTWPIYPRTAA